MLCRELHVDLFAAVFMLFACWPLYLLRDRLIRGFMTDTFRPLAYFSFESCPQLYFLGNALRRCGMLFMHSVPCLARKGWLGFFLLSKADVSYAQALHTGVSATCVSSRAGISSQKLNKKKKN